MADYLFALDYTGAADPAGGSSLRAARRDRLGRPGPVASPRLPWSSRSRPTPAAPPPTRPWSCRGRASATGLTVDFGVGVAVDSLTCVGPSEFTGLHHHRRGRRPRAARHHRDQPGRAAGRRRRPVHGGRVRSLDRYLWVLDSRERPPAPLLHQRREARGDLRHVAGGPRRLGAGPRLRRHGPLAGRGRHRRHRGQDRHHGRRPVGPAVIHRSARRHGHGPRHGLRRHGLLDSQQRLATRSTGSSPADGAILRDHSGARAPKPRGATWADGRLYCNDKDTGRRVRLGSRIRPAGAWSSTRPTPPGATPATSTRRV